MVVFIVGKSGSGKSYLAKDMIRKAIPYRKVLLINNNPEYHKDVKGFSPFVVKEPHKYDWNKVLETDINPHIELLVNTDDLNDELDRIAEAVLKKGNILVVIDEARIYYPQYNHSRGIERLINVGRKFNIDTMFISQIAVFVHRTVDSQVTYMIAFQTTRKAEIERMKLYFDDDAIRLKGMSDHQFMIANFLTGERGVGRL